ncbi:hypothetical protein F2Q69_00006824 [Brassica cretica]|uniref:Uncharacterized protein n=1 Tax=Brassica cretica TaxID=69181 RepID=A0A8S9P505_BRACR|nr:hypothetical protein F2Q69_00006824 [Brassica cretica]
MLRSGKRLATNTNNTEIGNSANAVEIGKSNSQPILLDDPDPKPSRENRKSTAEKNKEKSIDLEVQDDTEIEAKIDRQYGTHVDRPVKPVVDQYSDNRTDDYVRLMDASIEVANIEEDVDSDIIVDRYLREAVDRRDYRCVDRLFERCIERCASRHIDRLFLEIKRRQLRSEI